jgi:hypothetical protein
LDVSILLLGVPTAATIFGGLLSISINEKNMKFDKKK